MSIRHLESLFQPASVALIGASDQPGSLGTQILRNLQGGGFSGPIWLVNPHHAQIGGQMAWPDVASLPAVPDLAAAPLQRPAWLALSYDEEIGCIGVRRLLDVLETAPVRPFVCVVGEPTLMRVATGHKGKTALRAICHGQESHSALAPLAVNALHLGFDLAQRIRAIQARVAEQGQRDHQHRRAGDERVGNVEDREVRELNEVDDVAAPEAGLAGEPINEVAEQTAKQSAEGNRPADTAELACGAKDHDGHHDRDHAEDPGVARADAEGSPGVLGVGELHPRTDDLDRPLAVLQALDHGVDCPHLGQVIEDDGTNGDASQDDQGLAMARTRD
jgi:hypothetical protein